MSGKADKTALDGYLPKTGGEMTGPLVVNGNEDNILYALMIAKNKFKVGIQNNNKKQLGDIELSPPAIKFTVATESAENSLYLTPVGVLTNEKIEVAQNNQLTHKLYVDNAVSAIKPKAHKATLTVAGWDSTAKTQTVNVADVLADETKQLILPMPTSVSMTAYTEAGIMCTGQAAGKLTFTADTVPTETIEVYVTISDVNYS